MSFKRIFWILSFNLLFIAVGISGYIIFCFGIEYLFVTWNKFQVYYLSGGSSISYLSFKLTRKYYSWKNRLTGNE